MLYSYASGAGRTGTERVNRGGSSNSNARNVRAAYRNWNPPDNRNDNLGFRLARALGWTGRSAVDQVGIVRAGCARAEHPAGPGAQVGAAELLSNARRWSTWVGP